MSAIACIVISFMLFSNIFGQNLNEQLLNNIVSKLNQIDLIVDQTKGIQLQLNNTGYQLSDVDISLSQTRIQNSETQIQLSETQLQLSEVQLQLAEIQVQIAMLETRQSESFSSVELLLADAYVYDYHRSISLSESTTTQKYCTRLDSSMKEQQELSTSHGIYYDGSVTTVSVANNDCTFNNPRQVKFPKQGKPLNRTEYIMCPGLDVALKLGCPTSKTVIDISKWATYSLGDTTVAYGYLNTPTGLLSERLWTSQITGKVSYNISGEHFVGAHRAIVHSDEYVVSGSAPSDMSGGPAANGCGYLGMLHSRREDENQSLIVPAHLIVDCIKEHKERLSTGEKCPTLLKRTLPSQYLRDCHMSSATEQCESVSTVDK